MTALSPIAAAALGSLEASLNAGASSAAEPSFYEELRDGFARDMVEQFNTGTVVLIKPSPVQGDDPHNAFAEASLRTPRNAIVTGVAAEGESVLAGDRMVLIDASGFTTSNTPAGDDQVEIDGKVHQLVRLSPIPAAGVAVIYKMQCRTGAVAA